MAIDLVVFDMDGVLFEGHNFWLELHQKYGTEKAGLELASRYLTSDYNTLAILVARDLWKGKPASVYNSMVKERVYQPGVKEVFAYLKNENIPTAILSSGPYDLALRAQRDLGINEVLANRLSIEDGRLTGEVEVMVRDHDKQEIGRKVIARFETTPSNTAFVGDSDPDIGLAEIVGLPVAYNSESAALNRVCRYVLRYGELKGLISIVQSQSHSDDELSSRGILAS
jgi:phosphoserine phosphatase